MHMRLAQIATSMKDDALPAEGCRPLEGGALIALWIVNFNLHAA